jgi:methionyl-tRNA synthetase
MLMSAGLPVPRSVFVHGYLLVGGEKMSKTRLTGIHPFQLTDHFGVDAYRYYFLREVPFGQDGSFSWESMAARYNAELANGLGNLASRILAMAGSYFGGVVPEPSSRAGSGRLREAATALVERFPAHMEAFQLSEAVGALDEFVREGNRYLVEVAPWNLAKDEGRRQDLADSIYASLEALRLIAVVASPVMPGASARLWAQLGIAEPLSTQHLPGAAEWGLLKPGTPTSKGEALFPRLDG